jgi:hypothetical protein
MEMTKKIKKNQLKRQRNLINYLKEGKELEIKLNVILLQNL